MYAKPDEHFILDPSFDFAKTKNVTVFDFLDMLNPVRPLGPDKGLWSNLGII